MSIYVGAHRAKLCRGDWRPATLYKGGQYIAGAVDSAPVTLPGAIEDTYNDYVALTALGKGRQDSTYTGGIPSPSPDNPQPLVASGGSVSAHGKNLIPYESTKITLPTLRAIPDDSGGWIARDSMTPVPHMPGWYDVVRHVKEHVVTGHESTWIFNAGINDGIKVGGYFRGENVAGNALTKSLCSHFRNNYPAATKNENIANGEGFAAAGTTQLLYFSLYANRVQTNDLDGIKAFFAAQHAAGTPVTVWYQLATPTTERVYLGELKSYPQYTYISADGDYLPDMTATAKFNREE